ncbi:MAG: hypothetical protein ACOCV1_08095 [Bacillota bacterium]
MKKVFIIPKIPPYNTRTINNFYSAIYFMSYKNNHFSISSNFSWQYFLNQEIKLVDMSDAFFLVNLSNQMFKKIISYYNNNTILFYDFVLYFWNRMAVHNNREDLYADRIIFKKSKKTKPYIKRSKIMNTNLNTLYLPGRICVSYNRLTDIIFTLESVFDYFVNPEKRCFLGRLFADLCNFKLSKCYSKYRSDFIPRYSNILEKDYNEKYEIFNINIDISIKEKQTKHNSLGKELFDIINKVDQKTLKQIYQYSLISAQKGE